MKKLAVVSGATGGIGRAVTECLWQGGYSLLALGKTPAKCRAVDDWLCTHPRDGQTYDVMQMDVTKPQPHRHMSRSMEAFDGQVALLAVCHGASPQIRAALDCEAIDGLEAVWQVDVVGTLRLCQDVGSLMEQQRDGAIVIVSSLHAKMTYPQRLAYSISKASICAMARSLALEWGEFDIRVNSISPWQTSGERTQFFIDKEFKENGNDLLDAYHAKSPLKRLVSPRDIAETIIYLANNTSITGQDIVLDCGVSSSMWYKDY